MSLCIIELNDSEIRVARNTEIILRSPGYALIQENNVELGEAAARRAQLHPRATNNRYWHQLNQDALQYTSAAIRHNADLAYAHLLALHEQADRPDTVLFAAPGSYSRDQLALLLGLAEACPFQAVGLVDSAVAASAQNVGQDVAKGRCVHLDIHLHQAILTHLSISGEVARTSAQTIDGAGLATMYDACASMIAVLFIQQSRFDPQHHAETEQVLYNQLPQHLESLANNSEVLLEINCQGTQHQVRLLRQTLLQTLEPYYQKIIAAIPADVHCLVSDRLARLPGFIEQRDMTVLEPISIFQTCAAQLEHIRSTGPALSFITRLPVTARPIIKGTAASTVPAPALDRAETQATHILQGHRAYPLTDRALFLSARDASDKKQQDCLCSVFLQDGQITLQAEGPLAVLLNGRACNHRTGIKAGDLVGLAGSETEYLFIRVVP